MGKGNAPTAAANKAKAKSDAKAVARPITEKDPLKKQFHARKQLKQAVMAARKGEVTKALREIKRLAQRESLSTEYREQQDAKLSARLAWLKAADADLLVGHVLGESKEPLVGVAEGIMCVSACM